MSPAEDEADKENERPAAEQFDDADGSSISATKIIQLDSSSNDGKDFPLITKFHKNYQLNNFHFLTPAFDI